MSDDTQIPEYFSKEYLIENLLDPVGEIKQRIKFIEKISQEFDFIPEIKFEWTDSKLIYNQVFIERENKLVSSKKDYYSLLKKFAENMELISQTGFVHGDIKKQNIILHGESLFLVDLEPSLRQKKRGHSTLIYTPPGISLNDLKNDRLSSETDKLGFFIFVKRFIQQDYLRNNLKELMRKRREEEFEILPMPESIMLKMTFSKLLGLAAKNYFFQ